MTTRVSLTFDIEFDINGTFVSPASRRPRGIESLIGDSGESLGLTKALEILKDAEFPATFFIETAQIAHFGSQEMAHAAKMIAAHGHELQLHIHPVWSIFRHPDWESRIQKSPPRSQEHDSFPAQTAEMAHELIAQGLSAFEHWGLDRPTAVRTGSLFIEPNAYAHFAASGLQVSSSVGVALNASSSPALRRYSAATNIEGVHELPVTSYFGCDHLLRRKLRLATLIGMGRAEQRALLATALDHRLPFVIVLSHASEFYHYSTEAGYRRNILTEKKLRQLCDVVDETPDLVPATISDLHAAYTETTDPSDDVALQVPTFKSVSRYPETLIHR